MFLKEFTRGTQVHIDDLIARVEAVSKNHFRDTGEFLDDDFEPFTLAELRRTDYFAKMHQQLRENQLEVDLSELRRRLRTFDAGDTGVVKAYVLINVLKHGYPEIFTDECLLGLQFQLECLSADGNIDYEGFLQLFMEEDGPAKPA